MPLSSSPSTQRRRVGGGRGLLVNSIHGVDTLRYVVVLYRLSTSNHNHGSTSFLCCSLSYIVFLHQTTTYSWSLAFSPLLSYIVFLHQTTTWQLLPSVKTLLSYIVFLHQTTTPAVCEDSGVLLSYIVFLHQTTTSLIYSSDSQSF